MAGKDDEEEDKTKQVDFRTLVDGGEHLRTACLIVIQGSESGRIYRLEGLAKAVLGRARDALVRIDDDGVSRHHARISATASGAVYLEDLESTNGTFCNGDRVVHHRLQDGDKIQIGETTILKFSYQDSVEEEFQRRQYESVTRDSLTHCYNKKFFSERLTVEMAHARRHERPLSLAMIDADHFKQVNDTYGHEAGDQVLRHLAQVLEKYLRVEDILARYGGEEFTVLMRETPRDQAVHICERVRQTLERTPCRVANTRLHITVSIGVATTGDDAVGYDEVDLLRLADQRLYKAKRTGRNRVC